MAEHKATLAALHASHETLEQNLTRRAQLRQEAQQTRADLDRAVATQRRMIREIDGRRDLNAQLTGELQLVQRRLQTALEAMEQGDAPRGAGVALPLRLFRGSLDWPVAGRMASGFGEPGRDDDQTRNGIEIESEPGSVVHVVHEGEVGFAGEFEGFGNFVVIDHGGRAYTLYGHLASTTVSRGAWVDRHAPIGEVARAPAGPSTLYFEIRIDDTPVNPIEWLRD